MPRYTAPVTVDGKEHRGHATADNQQAAWQKIHAAAASAFPGKTITVGYATEEKKKSEADALFGKLPKTFRDIFKK